MTIFDLQLLWYPLPQTSIPCRTSTHWSENL